MRQIGALGTGRHHVLTSQVEAESKRTKPQRVTLQQFTASNFYLLVVVVADSRVSQDLFQMSLQQATNTTDKPRLITSPSTPKKSSSKMSSTQSLNHLLNFTLPPRQTPQNLPRRNRRANGSNQVWNKERKYTAARYYDWHHLIVSILQDL